MSSQFSKKFGLFLVYALFLMQYCVATELIGQWKLNEELTEKLQPPLKKTKGVGGGFGAMIGGGGVLMPVPGGRSSPTASQTQTLKFPLLLECKELGLSAQKDQVSINCVDGSRREFFVGNRHGRKTVLKKKRLTESYTSTSRRVRHELTLNKQDQLIVTVTIRPRGGVSQKFVRAFDRGSKTPSA